MADHSYVRSFTDHTYARVFHIPHIYDHGVASFYPRMKRKRGGSCCCVIGCSNREGNGVKFHRFPMDPERRARWIDAVNRDNWQPSVHTRICGEHFINGKSDDSRSPDYIPTIYHEVKSVFNQTPSPQSLSVKSGKVKWKKRRLGYQVPPEIIVITDKSNAFDDDSKYEESEETQCSVSVVTSETASNSTRKAPSRSKKSKHNVSADKADAVMALLELGQPMTRNHRTQHSQANISPETNPSCKNLEADGESIIFLTVNDTSVRDNEKLSMAEPTTRSHFEAHSPMKSSIYKVLKPTHSSQNKLTPLIITTNTKS